MVSGMDMNCKRDWIIKTFHFHLLPKTFKDSSGFVWFWKKKRKKWIIGTTDSWRVKHLEFLYISAIDIEFLIFIFISLAWV